MPGHLFVLRGDLTRLSCDAWALPTDGGMNIEPYWLEGVPTEVRHSLRLPPEGWSERRAAPATHWMPNAPRPWLLNVVGSFTRLAEALTAFVAGASQAAPMHGRERPLLALPLLATGRGGAAGIKGELVQRLLDILYGLLDRYQVDLALVTHTAAAFTAVQKARPRPSLRPSQQRLAEHARMGELVLFLGAGVSMAAGLPSWSGLLSGLAQDAGLDLGELARLDLLDQGSILQRRLPDLSQRIADSLGRTRHYALLHGLLASLPVGEIVTQNYDRLFEQASAGAGRPVAVLPYEPGRTGGQRWLLKMHGCVEHPEDIVVRREDYLRYSQSRAALRGIVQALLMTRKMLFVGFSLTDGNFHQVIDDVRLAVRDLGEPFGTALFLRPSRLLEELWQDELELLDLETPRQLEIFLDGVLAGATSVTEHLLDPTFDALLSHAEREVREMLTSLQVSPEARRTEAWAEVQRLLRRLGGYQP